MERTNNTVCAPKEKFSRLGSTPTGVVGLHGGRQPHNEQSGKTKKKKVEEPPTGWPLHHKQPPDAPKGRQAANQTTTALVSLDPEGAKETRDHSTPSYLAALFKGVTNKSKATSRPAQAVYAFRKLNETASTLAPGRYPTKTR